MYSPRTLLITFDTERNWPVERSVGDQHILDHVRRSFGPSIILVRSQLHRPRAVYQTVVAIEM